MSKTKIPWATDVWNPTVGCTKLSAGCKNCYAERIFERFNTGQKFSEVRCYPERLDQPMHWEKPRRIFVDSMSDLFHEDVPSLFIDQVFETMYLAYWHTFMILTKRAVHMWDYVSWRYISNQSAILPNVWLGVSIENQPTADNRITWLLKTPATMRFVSVEPILGEVDLDKHEFLCETWSKGGITIGTYLDWVICGCESGPNARPMDLDWARSLRDQCQAAGVPFFLKQAKIDGKLTKMPVIDGKIWDEIPLKSNKNG
jgi:protein gp37